MHRAPTRRLGAVVFALVVFVALLVPARAAWAAFHFMKVREVYASSLADPNAQYVELQMYAGGQTQVANHTIFVFSANGTQVGMFKFTSAVSVGTNQSTILIGTPEAAAFFDVEMDLLMTAAILRAGGKVCFDTIDCVSFGNYTGSMTGVGLPANPVGGIPVGDALTRKITGGANPTLLEDADDTDSSLNDFEVTAPTPRNNAGVNGTVPPDTCGNGAVNAPEACDDGNADNTDACLTRCADASCGDGFVRTGVESCDDGNTTSGDGCSSACVAEIPDAGPDADPLAPDAAPPPDAAPIPDAAPGPDVLVHQDGGPGGTPVSDDGCGCRVAARRQGHTGGALILLVALVLLRRRGDGVAKLTFGR